MFICYTIICVYNSLFSEFILLNLCIQKNFRLILFKILQNIYRRLRIEAKPSTEHYITTIYFVDIKIPIYTAYVIFIVIRIIA